jgi:hypothetical protein
LLQGTEQLCRHAAVLPNGVVSAWLWCFGGWWLVEKKEGFEE